MNKRTIKKENIETGKEIRKALWESYKFMLKILAVAIVFLIILAILGPMIGGQILPYFGLVYLATLYFLFGRNFSIRVKVIIAASALVMIALAISLWEK